MKSFPVRAMLFMFLAAAATAQAHPYSDTGLLPAGPAVVTLSGTLQSQNGLMVLVLDSPVALQGEDGHSVDVGLQSQVEVIGVVASTRNFHPEHITVSGTLAHGGRGELISITVQGPLKTG